MSIFDTIKGELSTASVAQVHGWLNAAEKMIGDARAAIHAHGKDMDANLTVAMDVADALTGVPIIGTYAKEAEYGLMAVKFMIDHGHPITDKDPNYNEPAGSGSITTA